MQRFIYLHGFASGAQSRKARFFGERMRETGRLLETPDLAGAISRILRSVGNCRY